MILVSDTLRCRICSASPSTKLSWTAVFWKISKAIRAAWGKDVVVIPNQASGASDSMFYRALGVPAYNASPVFTRRDERFNHGLDERVRVVNVKPALTFYFNLIPDLTK